jgi:hypothetical protein
MKLSNYYKAKASVVIQRHIRDTSNTISGSFNTWFLAQEKPPNQG